MRTDFIKVNAGFFAVMMLSYAPLVLIQKLLPNIFVSSTANGLTMMLTVPFLPYFHANISRRKGCMAAFGLAGIFTLGQYILDPTSCTSCLNGTEFIWMLLFFSIARFFTNFASNFYINVIN